MVLKAEEYAKQKQDTNTLKAQEAKKWGLTVDEYREQIEMIIKAGAHQPQELSLYPSGGDPAQPAATSDPSNFTLDTLVQIESHEGRPLYGTIRWIGTLPGYTGYYAGVELVSLYNGNIVEYLITNRFRQNNLFLLPNFIGPLS